MSKLKVALPQRKINVTSKSPVGDISVVTLIRTDTTLDHSQKAEKVCLVSRCRQTVKNMQNTHAPFGGTRIDNLMGTRKSTWISKAMAEHRGARAQKGKASP